MNKKNKNLQYFSDEYLERCKGMTYDQIAQFLEDYRMMHSENNISPSKPISIKIPVEMLRLFKAKSLLHGVPYQTQIKNLMREWLKE